MEEKNEREIPRRTIVEAIKAKFHAMSYIGRVRQNFGGKFLIQLISTYTGVKGIMFQLLVLSKLPLYKSMKLDGLRYQSATTVAMIPWSMKGIIGVISDGLPLFGYNKRPYMLLFSIFGSIAAILLAVLPLELGVEYIFLFPILLFFCHLQISTMDLLCEGMYSRLMVQKPESKADIVSFVWLAITFGTLIASSINGPIVDYLGVKTVFWFVLPFAIQSTIPTLLGFMPEKKVPGGLCNKRAVVTNVIDTEIQPVDTTIETEIRKKKKKAFLLGGLMSICALGQAFMSAFSTYQYTFIYAISVSVFLCIMNFVCLNKIIARCNTYLFLTAALYVSITGALDFFYTADKECLLDGPNFSYTYYNTVTNIIGTIASMIGIYMFQTLFSNWRIQKIFLISTVLKILASGFDIIIVKRWNRTILHLNDHAAYLLGDAMIEKVCDMLNFMPSIVLTSKLCPKDLESTVFAILAGFLNFGSAVARSTGVILIQKMNIKTTAPNCNFDNLPMLILIAHGLMPLLTIPLVYLLIPNKKFDDTTEQLLQESHEQDRHNHGPANINITTCNNFHSPSKSINSISNISPTSKIHSPNLYSNYSDIEEFKFLCPESNMESSEDSNEDFKKKKKKKKPASLLQTPTSNNRIFRIPHQRNISLSITQNVIGKRQSQKSTS